MIHSTASPQRIHRSEGVHSEHAADPQHSATTCDPQAVHSEPAVGNLWKSGGNPVDHNAWSDSVGCYAVVARG